MDTELQLASRDGLRCTASLVAGRVDLAWTCRTATPQPVRYRLLRRRLRFPLQPADPSDGSVCVVDTLIPQPPPPPHDASQTSANGGAAASFRVIEEEDPDAGEKTFRILVTETGLEEGTWYYTLFSGDGRKVAAAGRSFAVATGEHGFAGRLYGLLPRVHRALDEPSPAEVGHGPLRKYLEVAGSALDFIRSRAEGLAQCHDVLQARADLLPHMAQLIGWELDQTRDEIAKRQEILFAPELYRTVGTLPNLRGLVSRLTGWQCRIKEFADNVCLSNAPEKLHLWEIWESAAEAANPSSWEVPRQQTFCDTFDGRPSLFGASPKTLRLFWPSNRGGRTGICYGRLDDPSPAELTFCHHNNVRLLLEDVSSPSVLTETGESLQIVLEAGKAGCKDVWVTTPVRVAELDAGSSETLTPLTAINLSSHPRADDSEPAAVNWGGMKWVFWQSNRRGPTDIWARTHDGKGWGAPRRISNAQWRHGSPAVVALDDLWLFFCDYYHGANGICSRLACQRFDGNRWSQIQYLTSGPRDESPAAVSYPVSGGKGILLLWHAPDRDGHCQLLAKAFMQGRWRNEATAVTNHPADDKDPVAVFDPSAGKIRLFWRSQRGGYFRVKGQEPIGGYPLQSCTLDTSNAEMVAEVRTGKGSFSNRVHYTYDTALHDDAWCRRDTVGVFVSGKGGEPEQFQKGREVIRSLCRGFLPIQVRVLLIQERLPYRVFTGGFGDMGIGGHLV